MRAQARLRWSGTGRAAAMMRSSAAALLAVIAWNAPALAAQQNAPSVAANVDDVTGMSQRRPLVAPTYQGAATPAPEDISKAQLLPGSLLSMDVYDTPELSGLALRIDQTGDVTIPTLGTVHLAGLTVTQAQEAITKALIKGEILVAPNVKLNVVQFAAEYVSVLGEVQSPGRFQLIAPRSLADVLALAGGETLAAGDDIEIQRAAFSTNLTARSRCRAKANCMFVTRSAIQSQTCATWPFIRATACMCDGLVWSM